MIRRCIYPTKALIANANMGKDSTPAAMPEQFLCERYSDKDIQTEIYQAQVRHKEFACRLNVVIIVKTNLKTQAKRSCDFVYQ